MLTELNISVISVFKAQSNKGYTKELLRFAAFGLSAGVIEIFSELVTRAFVISSIGIYRRGIYTPVIDRSNLFTGFITPSIITYLYPRFSEAKTDIELNYIINDSLRFITLLMIPFILISIPVMFQSFPYFT